MPQYQIPQWLIPTETPGQALARGVESGATIARGFNENYWRSKDEERQNALEPLRRQQMAMAIKNQALDVEINQAKVQTMLAQKESYADLANLNAQVASQPDGYLNEDNFSKFWQLGQQHPALLGDPVFANTMKQFHTAKQMKMLQEQAQAQKEYRDGLLGVKSAELQGKEDRNAATNASREKVASIRNQYQGHIKNVNLTPFTTEISNLRGQQRDLTSTYNRNLASLGPAPEPGVKAKLDRMYREAYAPLNDKIAKVTEDMKAALIPPTQPGEASDPGYISTDEPMAERPAGTAPESPLPPAVTSGPAYDANKQRLQQWKSNAQEAEANKDPLNLFSDEQ